jgi:hypothetical protein
MWHTLAPHIIDYARHTGETIVFPVQMADEAVKTAELMTGERPDTRKVERLKKLLSLTMEIQEAIQRAP